VTALAVGAGNEARPARAPMHVLVLPSWYASPTAPLNGSFFRQQALAVADQGARVGVLYADLRGLSTLRRGGLRHNCFQLSWQDDAGLATLRLGAWAPPRSAGARMWLWRRFGLKLFEQYVRRHGRPDLLHVQSALWAGAAALELRRHHGVPYLITEHSSAYARGLIGRRAAARLRAILAGAAGLFAVSYALAREMAPYVADRPIEIVPNMVDTNFFSMPPTGGREPPPPFRLLTVAWLKPLKGIDVLLRAFAAAFARRPEVMLEIGGDGGERAALEALARELAIAEQVRFLGALSPAEVRDALHRAHHFVLPSLTESFGLVLAEAMATGLPVIATRCGGPEEVIEQGTGRLVPPGNVTALAEALREAYHCGPLDQTGAAWLRRSVVGRFDRKVIATTLLDRYRTLTEPTFQQPNPA
jgi:glycosyltransferase involved in cell wall biosynthesis